MKAITVCQPWVAAQHLELDWKPLPYPADVLDVRQATLLAAETAMAGLLGREDL